jgi:hypothetical protein
MIEVGGYKKIRSPSQGDEFTNYISEVIDEKARTYMSEIGKAFNNMHIELIRNF